MDDAVRDALVELCRAHGTEMLDDPAKLEAFLRDMCPGRKAEIHCLVSAVRDGAVADLRGAGGDLPPEATAERLAVRLREDLSMEGEAAEWTAWSLADALATEPAPAEGTEPLDVVEPEPSVVESAGSPVEIVASPVEVSARAEDDTAPSTELVADLDGNLRPGEEPASDGSAAESSDSPEDADEGDLGGDLRPGVSRPPSLEETPGSTDANMAQPAAPRSGSHRGYWIGSAIAVAAVVAIVAVTLTASSQSPPAGQNTPQPVATVPAENVVTPTPAETYYGPPDTVSIYPGDSLEDAYHEVAVGGTIRLAAGIYRVSSLEISDDVKLVGAGARRTKVVFSHSSSGLAIDSGRVVVRGIGFSLMGRPNKASNSVSYIGSAHAEFSHCRFAAGYSGVAAGGMSRVTLRHCVVSGSYACGVEAWDRSRLTVLSCLVDNSRKHNNAAGAWSCIRATDHARVDCTDTRCRSRSGFGILYIDKSLGSLTGNSCEGALWGIQVQDNAHVDIRSGNTNVQYVH